jgi:hypothetical protein
MPPQTQTYHSPRIEDHCGDATFKYSTKTYPPYQYAVRKSKVLLGHRGPEWERKTVMDLDSELNKWIDSLPDHRALASIDKVVRRPTHPLLVRWDPHREDPVFFHQSAHLHAAYYSLQISIHRPFVPQSGKHSALGLPSLTICTNAARASARVIDAHQRRRGLVPTQIVRLTSMNTSQMLTT